MQQLKRVIYSVVTSKFICSLFSALAVFSLESNAKYVIIMSDCFVCIPKIIEVSTHRTVSAAVCEVYQHLPWWH